MGRYLVLLIAMLSGCVTAFCQESRTEIGVDFPVGSGTLSLSFGNNATNLPRLISLFEKIKNDTAVELTGVTFSGNTSPEGAYELNRRLSVERMSAMERYVRDRVDIPEHLITRRSDGIAWDRLTELVEASSMPGRDDVLRVLRDVPEVVWDSCGKMADSRRKHLMDLHGGRTWHYMTDHFFKPLRNASVVVITVRQLPAPAVVRKQPLSAVAASPAGIVAAAPGPVAYAIAAVEEAATPSWRGSFPLYMSVKTNMLYDLLALPNVGVEFYLGRNWSVTADWVYGWWNSNRRHRYWRAYGGEIAVRHWFGRAAEAKPLTGHHLGLYGQLLTYDFEFGGKGQIAGEPGKPLWSNPSYAAGVEYGYSLPITRVLNIDFTLGVGYLGGKYYEYIPLDGHYVWQATKRRHWFGPTRAEVSLVWLLGRGNVNKIRKGGAR